MKTADEAMAQRNIMVDVDVLAAQAPVTGPAIDALDFFFQYWVVPGCGLAHAAASERVVFVVGTNVAAVSAVPPILACFRAKYWPS
jgi:hypothetical protein